MRAMMQKEDEHGEKDVRDRSAILRQRIEEGALRAFQYNSRASVADIAKEANIGMSSIYAHYQSKYHLMGKTMLRNIRRATKITSSFMAALDDGSVSDDVISWFLELVRCGAGSMSSVFKHSVPVEFLDELDASSRELVDIIEKYLSKCRVLRIVSSQVSAADIHFSLTAVQSLRQSSDIDGDKLLRYAYFIAVGFTSPFCFNTFTGPGIPTYSEVE